MRYGWGGARGGREGQGGEGSKTRVRGSKGVRMEQGGHSQTQGPCYPCSPHSPLPSSLLTHEAPRAPGPSLGPQKALRAFRSLQQPLESFGTSVRLRDIVPLAPLAPVLPLCSSSPLTPWASLNSWGLRKPWEPLEVFSSLRASVRLRGLVLPAPPHPLSLPGPWGLRKPWKPLDQPIWVKGQWVKGAKGGKGEQRGWREWRQVKGVKGSKVYCILGFRVPNT